MIRTQVQMLHNVPTPKKLAYVRSENNVIVAVDHNLNLSSQACQWSRVTADLDESSYAKHLECILILGTRAFSDRQKICDFMKSIYKRMPLICFFFFFTKINKKYCLSLTAFASVSSFFRFFSYAQCHCLLMAVFGGSGCINQYLQISSVFVDGGLIGRK